MLHLLITGQHKMATGFSTQGVPEIDNINVALCMLGGVKRIKLVQRCTAQNEEVYDGVLSTSLTSSASPYCNRDIFLEFDRRNKCIGVVTMRDEKSARPIFQISGNGQELRCSDHLCLILLDGTGLGEAVGSVINDHINMTSMNCIRRGTSGSIRIVNQLDNDIAILRPYRAAYQDEVGVTILEDVDNISIALLIVLGFKMLMRLDFSQMVVCSTTQSDTEWDELFPIDLSTCNPQVNRPPGFDLQSCLENFNSMCIMKTARATRKNSNDQEFVLANCFDNQPMCLLRLGKTGPINLTLRATSVKGGQDMLFYAKNVDDYNQRSCVERNPQTKVGSVFRSEMINKTNVPVINVIATKAPGINKEFMFYHHGDRDASIGCLACDMDRGLVLLHLRESVCELTVDEKTLILVFAVKAMLNFYQTFISLCGKPIGVTSKHTLLRQLEETIDPETSTPLMKEVKPCSDIDTPQKGSVRSYINTYVGVPRPTSEATKHCSPQSGSPGAPALIPRTQFTTTHWRMLNEMLGDYTIKKVQLKAVDNRIFFELRQACPTNTLLRIETRGKSMVARAVPTLDMFCVANMADEEYKVVDSPTGSKVGTVSSCFLDCNEKPRLVATKNTLCLQEDGTGLHPTKVDFTLNCQRRVRLCCTERGEMHLKVYCRLSAKAIALVIAYSIKMGLLMYKLGNSTDNEFVC